MDTMERLVKAKAPSQKKVRVLLTRSKTTCRPSVEQGSFTSRLHWTVHCCLGATEALVQHRMTMHRHPTKDCVDCCPSLYQSYSLVNIVHPSGVRVVLQTCDGPSESEAGQNESQTVYDVQDSSVQRCISGFFNHS